MKRTSIGDHQPPETICWEETQIHSHRDVLSHKLREDIPEVHYGRVLGPRTSATTLDDTTARRAPENVRNFRIALAIDLNAVNQGFSMWSFDIRRGPPS